MNTNWTNNSDSEYLTLRYYAMSQTSDLNRKAEGYKHLLIIAKANKWIL
jgi:hypothetical protein